MADTVTMPKLGFDMAEGTLVRWVKKVGETVNKGDVLAEIETDKATVEVESSASGVIRMLLVDEGAIVPVNSPIAIVGTADEVISEQAPASAVPVAAGAQPTPVSDQPKAAAVMAQAPIPAVETMPVPVAGPVRASPLAKKIARVEKVDLAKIHGTGPGGRIVRRDVESALSTVDNKPQSTANIPLSPVQRSSSAADETVRLTKLRQAIARRMTESKASIPHFYVSHEYKMDALMDMRVQFNKIVPENEKISVNDFIVKAVALALRQFPNLNASLNGDAILHHGQVNVGIAVSVEAGLLTIVCRDADQKPLRQISGDVKAMAARVREGKVRPDDIEGSTFSISNLGMYDVENFTAIINPPEAAILAVGSAREVPVVENGTVKPGWRMKATISVDHRVSDGVEAAKFMQALAVYLEEPLRLVL
jgi:pyruvate dehydrogenase E2 component (dihydrolipoamide acetyltransferase)